MSPEVEPTITLLDNEDGWWTARHPAVGVTTQGEPRGSGTRTFGRGRARSPASTRRRFGRSSETGRSLVRHVDAIPNPQLTVNYRRIGPCKRLWYYEGYY